MSFLGGHARGLDVIGAVDYDEGGDVLGMRDMQAARRDIDSLKPVTTAIAKILLRGGQAAVEGAIAGAKQPWYKPNLPGEKRRDEVLWKLRWHADQLLKLPTSDSQVYAHAADLKKWVLEAYIEANAVEEGAAYLDAAWNRMWDEIAEALKRIPTELLKAAGSLAAAVVPTWAWVVGGVTLASVAGFTIWRIVRR